MNYKKIITSVLLVSDGSVEHEYFCDNFEISENKNFLSLVNFNLLLECFLKKSSLEFR